MSSYASNNVYSLLTFQQGRSLGLVVYQNNSQIMVKITPESLKKDVRYRLLNIFRPYCLSENNQVIFSIDADQIQKEMDWVEENKENSDAIYDFFENYGVKNKDQHYLVVAELNL